MSQGKRVDRGKEGAQKARGHTEGKRGSARERHTGVEGGISSQIAKHAQTCR